MKTELPDRLFAQEVLSGKYNKDFKGTPTPQLSRLEMQKSLDLPSKESPWIIGALLIVLASADYHVLNNCLNTHVPFIYLSVFLALVYVMSFTIACRNERKLEKYDKLLQEAVSELASLSKEADDFMSQLNRRIEIELKGAKGVNDSYTLFLLLQIRDRLARRFDKVCYVMSDLTSDNIMTAYSLLKRPIHVRDSIVEGVGRRHAIPLSMVRAFSVPLREYVDKNLSTIAAHQTRVTEYYNKRWKAA